MLWTLPLLPIASGALIWAFARGRRRAALAAGAALAATLAVAVWAAAAGVTALWPWGAGLELRLSARGLAGPAGVLVPAVGGPVAVYAALHEDRRGLERLTGLLVAFVGVMEMLVAASDFLTLIVGWELVAAVSWALIAHEWRDGENATAAAQVFNVTRLGELGLFVAAGTVFAASGSFSYGGLARLNGAALHLAAAGVFLAAIAKSAQLPFSPWLFAAMRGPTSASALLHSATMVAAGVYVLIRLQSLLVRAWWFAPAAVIVGAVTAVAGGVTASVQSEIKKVLAASTSAQYGLMLVAVGAGFPLAASSHLFAHAVFKSLLFLGAGVAITAAGTHELTRMRLGSQMPAAAGLTLTGALALAAVPPLGAAWTKDQIAAAAGHYSWWALALVLAAGALSAFYASRFWILTYGPGPRRAGERPGRGVAWVMSLPAAAGVALGVLWLPAGERLARRVLGGPLAAASAWEMAVSWTAIAVAVAAAVVMSRKAAPPGIIARVASGWYGLGAAASMLVVGPALALAGALARFDDEVIDAGVRGVGAAARRFARALSSVDRVVVEGGVRAAAALGTQAAQLTSEGPERTVDALAEGAAALTGAAGRAIARLQSGPVHRYYLIVVAGTAVIVAAVVLGR